MKASDLFLKCLETEGIKRIYGVPGEENADFMMSQEESEVDFVLCRHEQGAAFMAEAHGRLTGEVGVCLGTLGPGATNLITGVADANMDRAPMLVITGQAHSRRQHKESHQAMDVVSMFKPVTKWATDVHMPDTIPEIIRKAVKVATTEKPGACLVELAEDVAEAQTTAKPIPPKRVRRAVPDDKVMDQAMDLIRSAKRPVILAGNGCIRKRASTQLRKFAERTGIGVINTFMAKGAVDMDAPYCLYTIGLQARDVAALAIESSDLIIAAGYDMVEYEPYLWNPNNDHRVLHMDFLPAEVDQYYHAEVEVVGDLGHALWALNDRLDKGIKLEVDTKQQQAVREEMHGDFTKYANDDQEGRIRPQKALWDARQVLGPHDILLSDVGAHKMWIARYYQCHEPNTCLVPNGFCSMGFALPGAIAAQLCYPDRRVMAVCGDGGFMMNVQEMETAKRMNANITVFLWQDDAYGLIAWKQQSHFGKHTKLDFGNPDFVKMAESFGWNGFSCDKSTDLQGVLEASYKAEGPSLVVIPIDYRENSLLSKRLGEIGCPI